MEGRRCRGSQGWSSGSVLMLVGGAGGVVVGRLRRLGRGGRRRGGGGEGGVELGSWEVLVAFWVDITGR